MFFILKTDFWKLSQLWFESVATANDEILEESQSVLDFFIWSGVCLCEM